MTETTPAPARRRSEQPDPTDVHVGARLRLRRNYVGMSQEHLGKASGLTFQQIQKYERGTNRMGASRLFQMARILGVSVAWFFEGLLPEVPEVGPGFGESGQTPLAGVAPDDADVMTRRETLDLIRAYYRITDPKQRRKIFELVKSMAD